MAGDWGEKARRPCGVDSVKFVCFFWQFFLNFNVWERGG